MTETIEKNINNLTMEIFVYTKTRKNIKYILNV